MSNAVVIRGLVKSFGNSRALDGVDLTVSVGEVHGFLGPNGSGKTTTLRCILGLLRADAGTVEVFGLDSWRDAVELHRKLAYVPGDVALWPNLTGGEVIDLLGRLRGGIDLVRKEELIDAFKLDPTKKSRSYSKGNRQKVALIAALASQSELLLLDEPTSGLDPLMESLFRTFIKEWVGEGRSVLLSSHILSEVEALSDRLSIIRDGKIVETGTLDDMRKFHRTAVAAQLRIPVEHFTAIDGVHDLVIDGVHLTCQVDTHALGQLMVALSDIGIDSLVTQPPTLEQVFLQHYGPNSP